MPHGSASILYVGSDGTHRTPQPALWRRLLYLPENTWVHWERDTWLGIPLRKLKSMTAPADRPVSLPQHLPAHPIGRRST